ncbi:MAG TPA: hypothetical protein VI727_07925 [Candidatus Brocadiaceae bacterium]|nr:hypothetical protein [Candidatus Brocadiaceae bacterium]
MSIFNKKDKVKPESSEPNLIDQLTLRITALEDKFAQHSHVSRNPIAIKETSPYPVLRIEGKDNKS